MGSDTTIPPPFPEDLMRLSDVDFETDGHINQVGDVTPFNEMADATDIGLDNITKGRM